MNIADVNLTLQSLSLPSFIFVSLFCNSENLGSNNFNLSIYLLYHLI